MPEKNEKILLTIESLDSELRGVAHPGGLTVFVPGALPGEEVEALIVKKEKRCAFAKVLRIVKESGERVPPACPYYAQCGACCGLHMTYQSTLQAKQDNVAQVMRRIGGIECPVRPVIGMENPDHYRNKTAMPVAMADGRACCGYFAPRSHRLVRVDDCLMSRKESMILNRVVLDWMGDYAIPPYDEQTKSGLIRHILTRVSQRGESMLCLCAASNEIPHTKELCERAFAQVQGLVSVCLTVNAKGDNVILGNSYTVLRGQKRLSDRLCGLDFDLSPLSFFQINPVQTERLYALALEFAGLQGREQVFDLYCGAGTISLMLARHCAHVTGIEIVPQAIADAKENARKNGIENADFYAGAAEKILPEMIKEGQRADVIVLDPPRKGAEIQVLQAILTAAPERIVYVSCDPATLARDLKILSDGYRVCALQPVDMFCRTAHVETVALLCKK